MDEPISGGQVLLAACAYVPPLFVIPLIPQLLKRPTARFVLFHTRQGLYLFSVALVLLVFLLALFWVARNQLELELLYKVIAVLVAVWSLVYLGLVIGMVVAVFRRSYAMIPLLGDYAGER